MAFTDELYRKIMALVALPTADSTDNASVSDAVGNKEDAAVTTVGATASLVAYIKGLLGRSVSDTVTTSTGTIVQDGTSGTPDMVTVATGASANTFGSWVALDASTAADYYLSHVSFSPVAGSTITYCLEIGTGGTPSTIFRFSTKVFMSSNVGYIGSATIALPVPIKIAQGTAVSARVSTTFAGSVDVAVGVAYYTGLE